MYQSFSDTSEGAKSAERIAKLRRHLALQGLDGFIIPHADEYQGEYLPAYAERLAWLTGFTGSAGTAIILRDKAVIFVDGRYTIQVREQIDQSVVSPLDVMQHRPSQWLQENIAADLKIGFDPWLMTAGETQKFERAALAANAELVACEKNPIDAIWTDQPTRKTARIFSQPLQFTGKSVDEKISQLKKQLEKKQADAAVITLSDSVSWAFNIRGNEITHNPVVLAYAIINATGKAQLFVDADLVDEDVKASLANAARIEPVAGFAKSLEKLGKSNAHVLLDKNTAPEQIRRILLEAHASIIDSPDPCVLPKATKTEAELNGARAAHRRDGVAMARFLCWLDQNSATGKLDEITVAKKLEALRNETGALKEISFDTISAAGEHAAIPHYRVTTASNKTLAPNSIYLCDSGAQYRDGTTDITRTVIIGQPGDDMIKCNTLVLKGMIALSLARFPVGTNGAQLDILARQFLWQAGLDFDHGTGHGVGSYLCVHEGPARIAKSGSVPLQAGMILSNEPGFYKQGAFGIRIENLVAVTKAEQTGDGERPMHGFETLTLAPIDRRLIDAGLLGNDERTWLNAYHNRVYHEISPFLDKPVSGWLKKATEKI